MKKSAFCLVLCLLLLCGCRKTTYISREDQLAQRASDTPTTVQNNAANQTADTSADTGTDNTTASVDSLPPASSDSTDASDSPNSTDGMKETEGNKSTGNTKATEGSKNTGNTKSTEGSKNTGNTKAAESTNAAENTNAASTADATDSATSETTDSTEPPETTEAPAFDPYDLSNYGVSSMAYSVHGAMNEQRSAAGMGELTLDSYLCAIASVRAYECSQYWSHNRLDGSYWSTILSDYGYGCSTAAENLAQGAIGLDGTTVVALWAGSESHLANIINPDFTRTGIGTCNYNGMTYVVCLVAG